MQAPVVTIDGPSAVGKSTVARLLAKRLGFHVLHTGVLYRQLALNTIGSGELDDEEVGLLASHLAGIPAIREKLLPPQRRARQFPGLVAEGRDTGTVVFPDATVKIYLDAFLSRRAEWRFLQLQEKISSVSYNQIFEDLHHRDQSDSTRSIAPTRKPDGAFVIDSTSLNIAEVVDLAFNHAKKELPNATQIPCA